MIKASDLTLYRGSRCLLQDASFVVHDGERVGLVGRNGCGKTSLITALYGQLDIDQGRLEIAADWRLSWVEQNIQSLDKPAREHVIDGDRRLRALQAERAQATDPNEIARLEIELEQAGAWQANSRAETLLSGLGFAPDEWLNPVGTFSGGWQMRLNLAQALMATSDLLLLDEPTNHLDLDATLWLERWLTSYQGTVVLISHDVEFLDSVCNVILHIEHQKVERYRGNYQAFIRQHAERSRQAHQIYERQTREAARLQGFIDRFRAKATKARQAQSRVKALARIQAVAPPESESSIEIRIPEPDHSPHILMRLKDVQAGYRDSSDQPHLILEDIQIRIEAQDRIGVLGVNGAGKSTLLKTLAGELSALAGEVEPGQGLKIGYFAQQQMSQLDAQATPLQHLLRLAPEAREQDLRSYLAQYGFVGDKTLEPVGPFSGGEKSRLALAIVLWHRPNLLVLDEPTNHLDIETRHALTVGLAQSEAALLLVSHDRHLLRTTVDQFWLVANGTVQDFEGDLDDYRQFILQKSNRTPKNETNGDTDSTDRKTIRRQQAQQRQALAQQRRPLEKALKVIESDLEKIQTRVQSIETQMQDPAFYDEATRSDERESTLKEHGQLSAQASELEAKWLDLMQEIETLEQTMTPEI